MSIISMRIKTHLRNACCHTLSWVLIAVLLSGCAVSNARPPTDAEAVLTAMLTSAPDAPVGITRIRTAIGHGEPTASDLNDTLFAALYGTNCLSWFEPITQPDGTIGSPIVDDAAIYLSTVQHPFELAVFRCTNSTGTIAAAKQCSRRLDGIRQAWRGSDEEVYAGRGCVEVVDNYVLLVVASDPEAVLDAARQIIK